MFGRQNDYLETLHLRLCAIVARFLSRFGVRFIDAPHGLIERVGHLAADFDSYLKDQILANRKITPVLLCAGRKAANEALLTHWSRYYRFVRNPIFDRLLRPFMAHPDLVDSFLIYCSVLRGASRTYDVQSHWAGRPPLLNLSDAEIARGEAQLRIMGVPKGAWFVCVHAREGGYSKVDEWMHCYRNSCIRDYQEAMREIVARGGWCIRMGDATMQPLPRTPGVIDYAVSASKSDWMDVFLCGRCHFFLGNSSGPFVIAGIFGRPSALANMAPLASAYSPFPDDISIPKLLIDESGQVVQFADAFEDEVSEYRLAPEFAERGFKQRDNTPEEIAELAIEMMDRLDGHIEETPRDAQLQERFRALVKPHHYCWPAPSSIGRAFLRRHHALLESSLEAE